MISGSCVDRLTPVVITTVAEPVEGGGVRVSTRGDLVEVGPRAGARERLSVEELRDLGAQFDIPNAFRSEWLGLQWAPRLRPRYFDTRGGGIRPLILRADCDGVPLQHHWQGFTAPRSADNGRQRGPGGTSVAAHREPRHALGYRRLLRPLRPRVQGGNDFLLSSAGLFERVADAGPCRPADMERG
jgi:hypothetical protein